MANCGCNEFSRSELLRGAAAKAGSGLPAIEPGMPLPAGTGLSRRSFMLRSAGLSMAIYGAASLSPRAFEEGIEEAAAAGPADAVLVSVFSLAASIRSACSRPPTIPLPEPSTHA